MDQGEHGYNSKLKAFDFLYLGVLLFGFSKFYALVWWPLFFIYFVIIYSIALDWRSANVMGQSGKLQYFVLDLITVFNYFGLINTMTQINGIDSDKLLLLLVHYAVIFFIYVAWNYAILFSNRNSTKNTKAFFDFFNIVGTINFLLCCFCILHHIKKFAFISEILFLILLFTIAILHLVELLIWTYKTYISSQ